MRIQHASFAQFNMLAHNRIRPDAHSRPNFRARRHNRLRMNLVPRSFRGLSHLNQAISQRIQFYRLDLGNHLGHETQVVIPNPRFLRVRALFVPL